MTSTTSQAALPTSSTAAAPARLAIFIYGVVTYGIGVTGLCWLIACSLGLVPFTGGPLHLASTGAAIAFNLSLVAVFGLQHAIMARPEFKARWTRVIPTPMERPTFVLLAGAIMGTAMWLWQPLPAVIWSVDAQALAIGIRVLGALGWAYMLAASFAINHFELFGLQQVWMQLRGRAEARVPFVQRFMYRFDRHPLMSGILIGLWLTPIMTLGHLVLSAGFTTYIVLGVAIEERDLVRLHGESYREYRRRVGSLVPSLAGRD